MRKRKFRMIARVFSFPDIFCGIRGILKKISKLKRDFLTLGLCLNDMGI